MSQATAAPTPLAPPSVTLRAVIDRVRTALADHGIPTGEPDGTVIVTGHRIAVLAADTRCTLPDTWTLIRVWPHDDPEQIVAVVERAIAAEVPRR